MSAPIEEKIPVYRIHALNGVFQLPSPQSDDIAKVAFVIGASDLTEMDAANPARFLYARPMVTTSGFGSYSTARTIEELQSAIPDHPGLYWFLFTLVAVYKDVTTLSFSLEQPALWSVYLETRTKQVYGWAPSTGAVDAYVIEKDKENDGDRFMNASEVMQALTVTAEHIRMGSHRFCIRTDDESQRFVVSMFDHGDPTVRYDVDFQLQQIEETLPVLH